MDVAALPFTPTSIDTTIRWDSISDLPAPDSFSDNMEHMQLVGVVSCLAGGGILFAGLVRYVREKRWLSHAFIGSISSTGGLVLLKIPYWEDERYQQTELQTTIAKIRTEWPSLAMIKQQHSELIQRELLTDELLQRVLLSEPITAEELLAKHGESFAKGLDAHQKSYLSRLWLNEIAKKTSNVEQVKQQIDVASNLQWVITEEDRTATLDWANRKWGTQLPPSEEESTFPPAIEEDDDIDPTASPQRTPPSPRSGSDEEDILDPFDFSTFPPLDLEVPFIKKPTLEPIAEEPLWEQLADQQGELTEAESRALGINIDKFLSLRRQFSISQVNISKRFEQVEAELQESLDCSVNHLTGLRKEQNERSEEQIRLENEFAQAEQHLLDEWNKSQEEELQKWNEEASIAVISSYNESIEPFTARFEKQKSELQILMNQENIERIQLLPGRMIGPYLRGSLKNCEQARATCTTLIQLLDTDDYENAKEAWSELMKLWMFKPPLTEAEWNTARMSGVVEIQKRSMQLKDIRAKLEKIHKDQQLEQTSADELYRLLGLWEKTADEQRQEEIGEEISQLRTDAQELENQILNLEAARVMEFAKCRANFINEIKLLLN